MILISLQKLPKMVEYLDKLDVAKGLNRCTKCNKSSNLVTLLLFYSKESLSWVYYQTNRVYYNHQGSMTFFSKSYRIVIYGQILTLNCHINWTNSVIFVHALERNKSLIPHAPGGSLITTTNLRTLHQSGLMK